MQPRIGKQNFFSVTAAPEFKVAIQKQPTHHTNCERRRGAGNEDSHAFDYELRCCSQIGIRTNIAA